MTWHWEDSHRALWQTEPMAFEALQEVFRFCLSVETLQETDWRKAWSCRPETEIPGGKKGKYSEFHREPVETLCFFYFLGQSESPWKRYARLGDLSYGGKAWGCFANLFKQRFCHLKMLWVWVVWISAFGLQWAPTGAHDFFRHFNRSGEVDFTKSTEEIGRSEQENVERSRGARNPVEIRTFEGKTVKTRCTVKCFFWCEIQFFGSTFNAIGQLTRGSLRCLTLPACNRCCNTPPQHKLLTTWHLSSLKVRSLHLCCCVGQFLPQFGGFEEMFAWWFLISLQWVSSSHLVSNFCTCWVDWHIIATNRQNLDVQNTIATPAKPDGFAVCFPLELPGSTSFARHLEGVSRSFGGSKLGKTFQVDIFTNW